MIFKLKDSEFKKMSDKLTKDVGLLLQEEFRKKFDSLKSYYGEGKMSQSIIFDPISRVVGSEEWGVAASDTGQDWNWSSLPPINKIAEWVRTDKDGGRYSGASTSIVNGIAYKVALKIKNEGIDSSFWVDSLLGDYVHSAGASGSGMI